MYSKERGRQKLYYWSHVVEQCNTTWEIVCKSWESGQIENMMQEEDVFQRSVWTHRKYLQQFLPNASSQRVLTFQSNKSCISPAPSLQKSFDKVRRNKKKNFLWLIFTKKSAIVKLDSWLSKYIIPPPKYQHTETFL